MGQSNAEARRPIAKLKAKKSQITLPDSSLIHRRWSSTHLTKAQYEQTRDVALRLLRDYSPDKHYFVGLGRSPSSISTFLEVLGAKTEHPELFRPFDWHGPDSELVSVLPMSDLKLMQKQGQPDIRLFDAHFEAFIPRSVLRGNNAIVLFDRSNPSTGGSSLAAAKRLLEGYLGRIGSSAQVVAVGLVPGNVALQSGVRSFDVSNFPNLFVYQQRNSWDEDEFVARYQGQAQRFTTDQYFAGRPYVFGKHPVSEPLSSVYENPLYRVFRAGMAIRMRHDEVLRGALSADLSQFVQP